MSKSDKLFIARYNDFYGCLLTEHQCEMIRLYYDCDISLFEIAEQFGVSRQAVRDTIKRAENALVEYEEKLHLFAKFSRLSAKLQDAMTEISGDDTSAAMQSLGELKCILEDNDGDI